VDDATFGSSDVSLPTATSSTSGLLAASDWATFSSKAASGACGANQFETASNASGAPSCAQPSFAGLSGAATKTQQFATTAYTDQSNTFTAGTQNFSAAAHTIPAKVGAVSSTPSSCIAGELYIASDQAREALKQCNSTGTFQSAAGIVTNGLIADYWMGNCDGTIGSGTVLADCSGQGNSGAVPSGGNPTGTQQGLTWATAVNAPVTLPTSVLNTFTTVEIYADMSIANNYNNTAQIQSFLSAGSSIVLWGNVDSATPLCCGLYGAWKGTPATQEVDPAVGPNFFTYVLDNNSDTICIGANCGVSYYSRGGNNPSTRSGPLMLGGNNVSAQMTGSIYRVIFYNRALSAAEVAQNDGAVNTWVGYKGVTRGKYTPQAASDTLICIGDSITLGVGATPACSSSMMTSLTDTFQIFNMGMSGEYLANMLIAGPKFASGINPNGKTNIAWIFGGTNDMCVPTNTLTPAQTLQKMIALARYMRSQGAKVMVLPMLSRTGSYQGTTCDALHDQYDALLMQNWPSFADAFVYGMLNDANLTGDGAYANATYFQADGIHPTVAGQQLIAGYAQSEINGLLTGTTNLAGIREAIATKTANYSATLGDSVILCNASSGPVTVTLPTAAGIPGRSFQVKKTDSSANVCTVVTSSGQTIDGATTVSLTSQYSSMKMASDNANWQVIQ
jgi:lysophospholipase L1-like esterase